jgi:hypothetical protein
VINACEFVNVETSTLSFCGLLVTDVFLLLIMLAGLLRLRTGGGGSFELGRLLWKQVGRLRFPIVTVLFFADTFGFLEGVIWLVIATAAEVPQAVKPGYLYRT